MHLTVASSVQRKDICGEKGPLFTFGDAQSIHSEEFEGQFLLLSYSLSAQSAESGENWLRAHLRTSSDLERFLGGPKLLNEGGMRIHYYFSTLYVQLFVGSADWERVQIELDRALSNPDLHVWLHVQLPDIDLEALKGEDHDGLFILGSPHLQLVQRKVP